jgi:hypothetical protein
LVVRAFVLVLGTALAVTASGCASDAPDTDTLPLASDLRVVSHEVRPGVAYGVSPGNDLLIVGSDGSHPASLRAKEIGYLRQLGWKLQTHFHDGSWALTSPDGGVAATVGSGLGTYCGFGGLRRQAPPGYPSICATLVNH